MVLPLVLFTMPASCQTFRITATNPTKGQIISAPVVFARLKDYGPLFTLGSPATSEFREKGAASW